MEQQLRVDWVGRLQCATGRLPTPVVHARFDLPAPRAVGLWLQQWQQYPQRLSTVTDELNLHRVAQAEHARVDVNLYTPCLALLREEFGVGEPGANHQKRVASSHHLVAGRRPQPTN